MNGELVEGQLTHSVIGAFYEVYNALGYGFLERAYMSALEHELRTRGHAVSREVAVPVSYKGRDIGTQRLDMVVGGAVIVEAKSTEILHPSASRQLFSYLRATQMEVGLLLHFGPKPRFYRVFCTGRKEPGSPHEMSARSD